VPMFAVAELRSLQTVIVNARICSLACGAVSSCARNKSVEFNYS